MSELPVDHESIGSVSAHCTRVSSQRRMDQEWLSDVACSADLLGRALRTRAAEVGGTLLVAERCVSRSEAVTAPDGPRISCRALVAASSAAEANEVPARAPPGGRPPAGEGPSVEEAWNTRVDYTPVRDVPHRGPRRLDLVAELSRQPIDHVSLGDLVVYCERGCSLDGAREAARTVASSVGADAAVGVRCVRDGPGWLCSGRATAFEREPVGSGRSP